MPARYVVNTVTLCGSTRFIAVFDEARRELAARGFSVFTVSGRLDKAKGEDKLPVKELLDLVYFNQILRSDAVLVVAAGKAPGLGEELPDGMLPLNYFGFSTSREIVWADMQGKPLVDMARFYDCRGVNWTWLCQDLRSGVHDAGLLARAREVLRLDGDAGRPS